MSCSRRTSRLPAEIAHSVIISLSPTASNAGITPRAVVTAAQRGDKSAWGTLFDLHYSRLYRFFRGRVANPQQAEDLAADVLLEAFRSVHDFQWQGKLFEAWLFGIARHVLASHYRSQRPQTTAAIENEPVVRNEFIAIEVRDILQRLPTEFQGALELRLIIGLTGAESAAVMGRSPGAFRSLLFRAVRAFKEESEHGLQGPARRRLDLQADLRQHLQDHLPDHIETNGSYRPGTDSSNEGNPTREPRLC